MSKTFLVLCQDLAREGGFSGNATAIADTANQTGDALRIVNWIKQVHLELQRKHTDWRWLRSSFTVNTVANDDSYAYGDCTDTLTSGLITRFGKWQISDTDGTPVFKRYLTSAGVGGQNFLFYLPWGEFRYLYKTGAQSNGVPVHFTIDPQNNLVIGPKPDAIYTISGDYQRSALDFTANGDAPEFPSDFHDLLWIMAMERSGRFSAAPEVLARSQAEGKRLLRHLERDQLPVIARARPLA